MPIPFVAFFPLYSLSKKNLISFIWILLWFFFMVFFFGNLFVGRSNGWLELGFYWTDSDFKFQSLAWWHWCLFPSWTFHSVHPSYMLLPIEFTQAVMVHFVILALVPSIWGDVYWGSQFKALKYPRYFLLHFPRSIYYRGGVFEKQDNSFELAIDLSYAHKSRPPTAERLCLLLTSLWSGVFPDERDSRTVSWRFLLSLSVTRNTSILTVVVWHRSST